jgi:hypothetical protein
MGPNVVARYDHELSALDGIGLTDVEMDAAVSLLAGHVEGAARRALEPMDEGPPLARLSASERFPTAMRVRKTTGESPEDLYGPEHSFEFGLNRILDGVQALLDGRSSDG